ncbi:hypothetical protein HKX48_006291 [Thoreauomyces humboldtii]|nr:hypothetical protein HKX48_006291 [Thoreauomyces humboldtii]
MFLAKPLQFAIVAAGSLFILVSASVDLSTEQPFTLFSYSLQAPYIEENLSNRWWDFAGDAYVEVNNYVRLTPDAPSKNGRLWGKHAFTNPSWSVDFLFKIHGSPSSLHGDGLAFWYTKQKDTEGPVFGSMDKFEGLGVFFDTYANARHRNSFPRINAMLGDGKTSYDHDHDGVAGEIGACEVDFRMQEAPTWARIKYVRENKRLEVWHHLSGLHPERGWVQCFAVDDIVLPESGYLGFSAHTGGVSDIHDIITVKTNGLSYTKKGGEKGSSASDNKDSTSSKPVERPVTKPSRSSGGGGGFLMGLLKFLLAALIVAALCYGVWVYAQRQESRSFKRF